MPLKRIAVLVSGSGSNLQAVINAVSSGEIQGEIAAVISDRKDAYALERAKKAGIYAVCLPKSGCSADEFNLKLEQIINSAKPDCIVLAGYLSYLDKELVIRYRNKILNVHPSLIPSFCGVGMYGKKVHRSVLEYGCKVSGATVHLVDEGMDTGPIVLQQCVPVLDGDNADSLAARVLEVEHTLLPRAIKLLLEDKLIVEGRNVKIKI